MTTTDQPDNPHKPSTVFNVRLSETERDAIKAIITSLREPYRREVSASDAVRYALMITAESLTNTNAE